MEITEHNRLIAEFMGIKTMQFKSADGKESFYKYVAPFDDNEEWVRIDDSCNGLRYHRSWEDIMEVVEKIEKMDYGFKMCRKAVEVYIDSTKEVIVKTKESCRQESLYKAVVEFIEGYNKKT